MQSVFSTKCYVLSCSILLPHIRNTISECLTVNANNDFRHVSVDLLDHCIFHLQPNSRESSNRLRNLGMAWIYLSLALIRLFVPHQPFDLSLNIMIKRDRYQYKKEKLKVKLKSLQIVRKNATTSVSRATPPTSCVPSADTISRLAGRRKLLLCRLLRSSGMLGERRKGRNKGYSFLP
jgi:midasin (ATPase involved in ribosome maturation)